MENTAGYALMSRIEGRAAAEAEDFDSVVSLYRPRIFRFALASLRDRDDADTVTQDCFLRAYQARERFRRDCSLETWLMQIAVNLVRDRVRNQRLQFWKRSQRDSISPEEMANALHNKECSPEQQILLNEQVRGVWRAAERLPEKQRTVFLLRFVEGMDLLDIAAATGMKEGTVKTHLFRALNTVRECLGGKQ